MRAITSPSRASGGSLRAGAHLALLGLLCLAGCGDAPVAQPATGGTPRYPRVVLVTIDTLRADHVGSYGYPRNTTPFLDRLAAQGPRFARALATMPHTAPSHASMLTGLSPLRHGLRANGQALPATLPTLAEVLGRAGFASAAVTSVGFLAGAARGFETVNARARPASGVNQAALEWLASLDAERRFFLWVHYYDLHGWYRETASERQRALVARRSAPDPDDRLERLARLHGWPLRAGELQLDPPHWGLTKRGRAGVAPFWVRSPDEAIAWIETYDWRLARVDAQIARLFRYVADRAPRAPTLWIVTSDHGEGLGGHGIYGHGRHLYNEQLQVPLLLYASDGSLPARRVDAPVSLVDLAATIEALVLGAEGSTAARALPGDSLVPLLHGDTAAPAEDRLLFAERRPVDALRESLGWRKGAVQSLQRGPWKYIAHEHGDDELYRLDADPQELDDLGQAGLPQAEELRRLLQARLATAGGGEAAPDDGRYRDELRALGYVE